MGWKHLGTQPKVENVHKPVREIIQGMAGGRVAHRANALKFGLYDALRQKKPANLSLVRLRCSDTACWAHRQPISYLSLGNSLTCVNHRDRWDRSSDISASMIMECSECSHPRTDRWTWCRGCRGVFG